MVKTWSGFLPQNKQTLQLWGQLEDTVARVRLEDEFGPWLAPALLQPRRGKVHPSSACRRIPVSEP